MAGKVIKSRFVLLSKFSANGLESASKTATSHIRKTLAARLDDLANPNISERNEQTKKIESE